MYNTPAPPEEIAGMDADDILDFAAELLVAGPARRTMVEMAYAPHLSTRKRLVAEALRQHEPFIAATKPDLKTLAEYIQETLFPEFPDCYTAADALAALDDEDHADDAPECYSDALSGF
jgi:hypothetical protein